METIGEKIYRLRKQRGLSQEELSFRIGVSRQIISQWEKNETLPKADKIIALSETFGVSTDYLLCTSANKSFNKETESVEFATYSAQVSDLNSETDSDISPKHIKKGSIAILIFVMILIMAMITFISILIVELLTYDTRGDYTVQGIGFGLTKQAIITLVVLVAFILISLLVFIGVSLIKRKKIKK